MMDHFSLCDEILTVQTGPLANRVGLHFWNYEAYFPSVAHDDTPRGGETIDRATHTPNIRSHVLCDDRSGLTVPRTLALDLSSSIDYGFHFDDTGSSGSNACPFWHGQVDSVFRSESDRPTMKSDQAEWTACFNQAIRRIWREKDMICTMSDTVYSSTSHTKTNNDAPSLSFTQGVDALRPSTALADEVDNRLRHLLERCDRPSAFQLITEAESGFVGLNLPLLDWWLDEFPKRPVITLAIYNSAETHREDVRVQRLAQAHQLILATRMESADEGLTHATWIPLDLSAITDSGPRSCLSSSLIAAGIDCITTKLRLTPDKGGLSPDDWIIRSQIGSLRRMLTARIGYEYTGAIDGSLRWRTLNPYHQGSTLGPDTSRWREACLRGVRLAPVGDRILQFATAPSGTVREADLAENASHCDPVVLYPFVDPGAKVSLCPQLANFPIRLHIDFGPSTPCAQPSVVRMASLLDAPGEQAVEWGQLRHLVNSFTTATGRSRPPPEGMEWDQWEDLLESSRRNLVDCCQDV